jgi:Uma2 family endonuclease
MSTDTAPSLRRYLNPAEAGRFQRRFEPPDPLYGPPNVNYPARDGRLVSDNTIQERWIDRIKGGLDALFADAPDVFLATNLGWYPVKGNNRRRLAPDVMAVFGRPKGDRESYVQHREGNVPPTVVFEILSPGNRKRVMDYKRKIYQMYGVEEYYDFNPYKIKLDVWINEGDAFRRIPEDQVSGWVSPKLGIRFELGDDLTIFRPDGRAFEDYWQIDRRANEAGLRADEEQRLRLESEHRADEEQRLRLESEHRADRLAAKLRALGLDPDE